ncbi:hypothetical protein FJZ39_01860 [Candidatus Saccharibacteria bacterium]|nr:hypothetical protein [Candidatus Saccharibacteria bacterium]
MFKKIVSNLPFSAALVGQLGIYARRLKKEEAARRVGLIFTALALVVQSFAVFSPPESANAADRDAVIYQTLRSKEELLRVYDQNRDNAGRQDIKQIYAHFGVTRDDIVRATQTKVRNDAYGGNLHFMGRTNAYPGRTTAHKVDNTSTTVYTTKWFGGPRDVKTYDMLVGKRAADGKWFAIMLVCGNLVFQGPPTTPPQKPSPSATCSGLRITKLSRNKFTFTANASTANGASVKTYTYTANDSSGKMVLNRTVESSSNSSSITTTLPDGSFTVNVSVLTSEGRKVSDQCSQKVTVTPAPPQPVAACTGLTLTPLNRTTVKAATTASATNGATIREYTYVVKDTSGKEVSKRTVASSATNNETELTLSDGNYVVSVTINTSVGSRSGDECTKSIVISPAPAASCNSLVASSLSRTNQRFVTTAATTNGATVSGYTYVITDKNGETHRQKVSSTALTHEYQYTFEQNGTYTIQVIVHTSQGDKTGESCKTTATINPEPRCELNPSLPLDSEQCKPCPDEPNLWYRDENCTANFELIKSVRNLTQNTDATQVTARANDVIEYSLTVKNTGLTTGKIAMKDDVTDSLQYANLISYDGANVSKPSELTQETLLSWEEVEIAPGATITKLVQVRVKNDIPSMAQHASSLQSYDCRMTNIFGNTTNVDVECPTEKAVEGVVSELPRTGAGVNMASAGIVAAIVAFLYARSRQLNTELRLVRKYVNAGSI